MMAVKNVERLLGMLLIFCTLVATLIVVIGGTLYVLQNGGEILPTNLIHATPQQTTIADVWRVAFSFTPVGIIQLGLLCLIATQIIRVAMLFGYYALIRDYYFSVICGFVLFVLLYSFIWRS